MKDGFSNYHPVVNFMYFTFVIAFSMIFMHPACLGISIVAAITYSIYLNGRSAVKFNLMFMLPLFIVTVFINPAFNHEGATILTYVGREGGNPLTLESILYGVSAAVMFISVISWFSCYNAVMTSDKFIYLFGRVIPSFSLILSMVLRFVPKFKAQFIVVSNAQKCIGRDVYNGNLIKRTKHGVKILSIMVTWMMENAIETSDSMKSRGYGLQGRTAFSIFSFNKHDKIAIAVICSLGIYVVASAFIGSLYFRYFPTIKGIGISFRLISTLFAYTALCFTPLIINIWEDRKWTRLKSKV